MATQRIVRVRVANAAKVGAVIGVAAGLVGGVGWIVYVVARSGLPQEDLALLPVIPVVGAGVAGLDGLLLGALAAVLFNLTTAASGGLVLDVEEVAPDAPA